MANLWAAIRPHVNQGSVSAALTMLVGLTALLFPAIVPFQSHLVAVGCGASGLVVNLFSLWSLVDEIVHSVKSSQLHSETPSWPEIVRYMESLAAKCLSEKIAEGK